MTITVNGRGCELPSGATVADLVRSVGARERGSAVAVDGEVVPRGEWERHRLADGQNIEVVTAVQGG